MASQRPRTATIAQLKLPLYIGSLWLALAVALLSSLMPGGLPRTTSLGSAFNPATTAVALQPSRAQPRLLVDTVRRDDHPDGQGGAFEAAPLALAPAVPPPLVPSLRQSAPELPPVPRAILNGSPRGPPPS